MPEDKLPPHYLLTRKFGSLNQREENPLNVWMALLYRLSQLPNQEGEAALAPHTEVTIPLWCAQYLAAVAEHIVTLHQGRDFRESVPRNLPLSPQEAAELLPAATAFTRPGWNAFAAMTATMEKMADAGELDRLRSSGMSAKEAYEILMDKRGIENEPSMRKRIARGRVLRYGQGSKPQG